MSWSGQGSQTDWHTGTSSSIDLVGHGRCSMHGDRTPHAQLRGCAHYDWTTEDEISQSAKKNIKFKLV